jgi:hypothetical protein
MYLLLGGTRYKNNSPLHSNFFYSISVVDFVSHTHPSTDEDFGISQSPPKIKKIPYLVSKILFVGLTSGKSSIGFYGGSCLTSKKEILEMISSQSF